MVVNTNHVGETILEGDVGKGNCRDRGRGLTVDSGGSGHEGEEGNGKESTHRGFLLWFSAFSVYF